MITRRKKNRGTCKAVSAINGVTNGNCKKK